MKFSVRQILASAAGAVIAALIASAFGVKGTIIGVAIGSAAATFGTAFVSQSLDQGHKAVKQVAERVPDSSASTLLRRLGGTTARGDAESSVDASAAPTEVVGTGGQGVGSGRTDSRTSPVSPATDETSEMERSAGETRRLEVSASPDAPATERLSAATAPMRRVAASSGSPPGRGAASSATASVSASASRAPVTRRTYSWKAMAGAAGIVFVLALLFITAVELISGKPLSDIFGGAGSGTSFGNIVDPGPAHTSTTTTTTTTTTTSSSTTSTSTTTSSTSSSTSTTAPSGQSTTTTSAPPSTTTTVNVGGSGTTTTASRSSTSP